MFIKVLVFYIITCISAAIMGALQPHLGLNENIVELTQLGPTIGVLTLVALYRRKHIALSIGTWKPDPAVIKRIGTALVIPLAAFAMTIGLYVLFGHGNQIDYLRPSTVAPCPFWIVVVLAFIGAAFEEIGWRCWLQPFLQTKFSVFSSSLVVGTLWGLWHIGNFSFGVGFMGIFMICAIAISIVLGQLLRGTRQNNLAIAATLHAMANLYLLLFFNEEKGNIFAMSVISTAWVVIAAGTLLWSKSKRTA